MSSFQNAFFNNIDKYFSTFIVANQSESFKTRELNDILPENNQGLVLIPQLLTNNAKDFIHTSKKIKQLGYNEINLNLGCPSGTLGIYFIGGNVYSSIMRSEILSSRSSKKIEKDTSSYEFSVKGVIVSNIIRDIKIIVRTPSLLMKCIGGSVLYSAILLIMILPFRRTVRVLFDSGSLNSIMVIMWILLSTAVNFTSITSFIGSFINLRKIKFNME